MKFYSLACLVLTPLALSACSAGNTEPPPFEAALERHVAAVTARDLDGIQATITAGEKLMLILPDGQRLQTREEYLDFHRRWFGDPAWSFKMDKIESSANGDYGHALYRTSFDPDADGQVKPSSSFLTLGFRLENGEWRLVHDQNTRIAVAESE